MFVRVDSRGRLVGGGLPLDGSGRTRNASSSSSSSVRSRPPPHVHQQHYLPAMDLPMAFVRTHHHHHSKEKKENEEEEEVLMGCEDVAWEPTGRGVLVVAHREWGVGWLRLRVDGDQQDDEKSKRYVLL